MNGFGNVASTFGSLFSGFLNMFNQRQMAETLHEYELDNMAMSARYQQAAENRHNMYNDPLAVSMRYRNAGMNPIAVMGSGQTDAGLQASISSSPAGGTSASPGGSVMPDLGASYAAGLNAESNAKIADAKALESAQQARILKAEADIKSFLASSESYLDSLKGEQEGKSEAVKADAALKKFMSSEEYLALLADEKKVQVENQKIQNELREYERDVIQPLIKTSYEKDNANKEQLLIKAKAETNKLAAEINNLYVQEELTYFQAWQAYAIAIKTWQQSIQTYEENLRKRYGIGTSTGVVGQLLDVVGTLGMRFEGTIGTLPSETFSGPGAPPARPMRH